MGKYDPLTTFLKGNQGREIRMTFREIERIVGQALPSKAKLIRAWWSNNPSNNVMTKAWLAAGYKTAQVDIAGETLVFTPAGKAQVVGFAESKQAKFGTRGDTDAAIQPPFEKKPRRHPAFGVWVGKVTLLPDYDYTQPSDPDWGKVYDG